MKTAMNLHLWVGIALLGFVSVVQADNAVTTTPATVRAGPDDSYPEVAQLDADTPLQVMGCLDDWSWCDVGFQGDRGWVYSPAITYEYQGGYVPFYAYAPGLGVPVVAFAIGAYWGSYYHDRPWYAQRDDWAHRGQPHHVRPPGPPPRSGPPPREAIVFKPHQEGHPNGSVRVTSANSPHGTDRPHDGSALPPQRRAPPPPPREQAHSTTHEEPAPSHEGRVGPAETRPAPEHAERARPQPREAAPQSHVEHAPAEHAPAGPPREEPRS